MIAAYGCSQVSIEFDFGYFLTDTDMAAYKFFETAKKYDKTPFTDSNIFFFSHGTNFDYYSEESQI